jgi:SAM-dependent methyltransferase
MGTERSSALSSAFLRRQQLAAGWDAAAQGYERYFVPRFAPWVSAAVATLDSLPPGPILVPCCGTFPELPPLLERYPDREIVGIDLSPGMVSLARARCADRPRMRVLVGDAATLDPAWIGRCAAVLSVFGLQQLPDPPLALQSWRSALAPGGVLSVVYWPGVTESEGPFALLRALRGGDSSPSPSPWESGLTLPSTILLRDELLSYPMTHPDAATFFAEYVHNGPMRSAPSAVVDELRPEFLRRAPSGPWTHYPRARLMVWREPRDSTGASAGSA